MLTSQECIDILGKSTVDDISQRLKTKGLNEDTINRALDYLALHTKCFPYLDNVQVTNNLINNLNSNIEYRGFMESLNLRHYNAAGYTDGVRVVVGVKRINNFFRPNKIIEQQVDHIVRHELEHVAMGRFDLLDSDDKIRKHIEENFESVSKSFGIDKPTDIEPYIIEQKTRLKNENAQYGGVPILFTTGISGRPNSPFRFGSTPLNEGITDMKINMMDDYANRDGYYFRSGYNGLEVQVAKHMAKIIGKERFLKMHQNADFSGITETYQELMGRDSEYMKEFFLELEQPHKIPPKNKTLPMILVGEARKKVGEIWQDLHGKPKTSEGAEFVKSFIED